MVGESPALGKDAVQDYTGAVSLLLSKGKSTLIDADDYHFVIEWKWYALQRGYIVSVDGQSRIRLHRLLTDAPSGLSVDHINGNPLDNRRRNLRICTQVENCRNARKPKAQAGRSGPTSQYKGVSRRPHLVARPWQAQIRVDDKVIYLGTFMHEDEAAAAYNSAALCYFGQFARLNIIPEKSSPLPSWDGKPSRDGKPHRFKSRYRGVTNHRSKRSPWYASITCQKEYHYLGCFQTEEEAALAYNAAAILLFGEKAYLNVLSASPDCTGSETQLS